jgi:hypothetical protein
MQHHFRKDIELCNSVPHPPVSKQDYTVKTQGVLHNCKITQQKKGISSRGM